MTYDRRLGAPGRSTAIEQLAEDLQTVGASDVRPFSHQAFDPQTGERYDLVELVGTFRPQASRRFVLATHFDTRPWADEDPDPAARSLPVPGANDGTSGVALLLELAGPLLRDLPSTVGFTIVLFDGEELGRPEHGGYCAGSRYLADLVAGGATDVLDQAEFGIVVDMVGATDLVIEREPSSIAQNPRWVDHLWRVARTHGIASFSDATRARAILDDHHFLSAAGVPSILLIDRAYPAWHTRTDTIDRLSTRSFDDVGRAMHLAILQWYGSPTDDDRQGL